MKHRQRYLDVAEGQRRAEGQMMPMRQAVAVKESAIRSENNHGDCPGTDVSRTTTYRHTGTSMTVAVTHDITHWSAVIHPVCLLTAEAGHRTGARPKPVTSSRRRRIHPRVDRRSR